MLKLSAEQLNTLDKDALVIIVASLQEQLSSMSQQLDNANERLADTSRQIELLTEQIRIMNQRQFGRKSESGLTIPKSKTARKRICGCIETGKPAVHIPSFYSTGKVPDTATTQEIS